MEKSKKRTIMQAIICIGLLCVIWGGYFFVSEKMNQKIGEILEDDFSWVVQVDEVRAEKSEFVIEGFAFKLNEDAKEGKFAIVLHDLNTDEYFFPKMEYVDREDVNEYFLCEYDYTKSGFVAKIKEEELDLKESDYEVLLRPKGKRNPYHFTTYLVDGNLMYAEPKMYAPIDVVGTEMEQIVEEGLLRTYSPENQVYVYQYNDRLYWFYKRSYPRFGDDGNLWMKYVIYTTQKNKLPLEQNEKEKYWSNCNFSFISKELKFNEKSEYRVAMCEMVTDYSISKISTGDISGNEEWSVSFRPRYQFEPK